jgi:hypothetical protein
MNEVIITIINELPLPQRVCVFYRYNDELSDSQIAEKLTVAESEVKSRLEAAETVIREKLEQLEDEEKRLPKGAALAPFLVPAIKAGIDSGLLSVSSSSQTAVVTGTSATAATTTVASKGVFAAIIAGVVVTCGIIAGVVVFGGNDEQEPPAATRDSSRAGESASESDTIDTPPQDLGTIDTSPQNPENTDSVPQFEELTRDDVEELLQLVAQFGQSPMFGEMPPFTDINEVGLEILLEHFAWHFEAEPDIEFTTEQAVEVGYEVLDWGLVGFYPENIDRVLRERLNPNFSIDNYDYQREHRLSLSRMLWQEQYGAFLWVRGSGGGFPVHIYEIMGMWVVDDEYFVSTMRVNPLGESYPSRIFEGFETLHYLFTFTKNMNGVFNLMSLVLGEGVGASWVDALERFYEVLYADGYDYRYFNRIAFVDESTVIIVNPGEWLWGGPFVKVIDLANMTMQDLDVSTFDESAYEFHELAMFEYGITFEQEVSEVFRDYY